jgi:hypothetical protein
MKKLIVAISLFAITMVLGSSVALSAVPKQASPTCASVSVAVVRHALGGDPTKPKSQASANVLICHYTTIDLVYLLHQSKALFRVDEKSNKGKPVPGLGTAAFTYSTKGSSVITLQVLDGTVAFILSGSSATLKNKETLAQKMLSLV